MAGRALAGIQTVHRCTLTGCGHIWPAQSTFQTESMSSLYAAGRRATEDGLIDGCMLTFMSTLMSEKPETSRTK